MIRTCGRQVLFAIPSISLREVSLNLSMNRKAFLEDQDMRICLQSQRNNNTMLHLGDVDHLAAEGEDCRK
jgi:hypothetical protein